MSKRIIRPGVRQGYDLWAATYDATPNPLVALDRRITLQALAARRGEWILDAGCGTGAHLQALDAAGAHAIGLDLSLGMLRVAQRGVPARLLVQADLHRPLPFHPARFDAALCALVSEHLGALGDFFAGVHAALRPGGRLVFSAFHPDLAAAGAEAHFDWQGQEVRLGAETHGIADFVGAAERAGFEGIRLQEHPGDEELAAQVPAATKYVGQPLLLLVEARHP